MGRLKGRRSLAPESEALRVLGDRVRAARREAGLSQARLGEPYFTRAYVSAVELGKIRPSMKALHFLAQRLGRPPSVFLDDDGGGEHEFARLRQEAYGLRRARPEALARERAAQLANGPSDLASLADREAAAAEARHRAGDLAAAIDGMRASLILRRAARELALAEEARRSLGRSLSGPPRR